MIKLDMHIHSWFSFDCMNDPERIAFAIKKKKLDGFAITDHNVFRVDFQRLKNCFHDLIIIPGMEIGTEIGDILVYFIEKEITTKNVTSVIQQAHEQGGIAVLAHPYHRKTVEYPDEILLQIDGIETANPHNVPEKSQKARALALQYNKSAFCGSDAHFLYEIGSGYTSVDIDKKEAQEYNSLKKALFAPTQTECFPYNSLPSFIVSQSIKYARRFGLLKQK